MAIRYRPLGVKAKSTTLKPIRRKDRESIRVPVLSYFVFAINTVAFHIIDG